MRTGEGEKVKKRTIIITSLKIVLLYTIVCGILYPTLLTIISVIRQMLLLR